MARTYSDTVTTPAAAKLVTASGTPFVSLLSDFGSRDPSAGIMRAVVTGICPTATIVDLSHGVSKFAIREGALLLWSAVPYLRIGAHVAVVDPGVGTARKGIAVQTSRGDYLIGPDNGLLMPAAARLGGITAAHLLENKRYSLSPMSSSFHGRDLFAPAAAHLVAGVPIDELGRAVDPRRLMELAWPRPEIEPGRVRSGVIYVDSFGNVKLSALVEDLEAALPGLRAGEALLVRVGSGDSASEVQLVWATTFGSVPQGAPLLTADSYGRASMSVHQGSAAERFGLKIDTPVGISRPPRPAPAPPPARRPSHRPPPTASQSRPPAPPTRPQD